MFYSPAGNKVTNKPDRIQENAHDTSFLPKKTRILFLIFSHISIMVSENMC